MEKEFTSYEQALALKELGFDKECFGWYDSNKNLYMNIQSKQTVLFHNLIGRFSCSVTAPLKQQVFRWFREKYFLDCEIYVQEERRHKFYHYLVLQLVRGNIEWKSKNTTRFKIYEEAESACIDKLIEIAKANNAH